MVQGTGAECEIQEEVKSDENRKKMRKYLLVVF